MFKDAIYMGSLPLTLKSTIIISFNRATRLLQIEFTLSDVQIFMGEYLTSFKYSLQLGMHSLSFLKGMYDPTKINNTFNLLNKGISDFLRSNFHWVCNVYLVF